MAIERFDLSIVALLEGCINRLSYTAITSYCFEFWSLDSIKIVKWLRKILAIERLALSILAILPRRSKQLSYTGLQHSHF